MTYKNKQDEIEYHKIYDPTWHKLNKVRTSALKLDRRCEIRNWFSELKKSMKCELCSESHSRCLDFHHIDPSTKTNNVSVMVSLGYGRKKILEEINKCRILCANCHRKI